MDKKEFATFAMAIRTYYPKENILPNQPAMELWYRELQDIPYAVAETALRKWVATNKWSPSIAEIRETAMGIRSGEQLTWGESWKLLKRAVTKYGMSGERAALESFDPLTRKVVECFGYKEFCNSSVTNEMADRAHFQRIFETIAKREQTEQQLALPLREAINMIQLKGMDGEVLKLGE